MTKQLGCVCTCTCSCACTTAHPQSYACHQHSTCHRRTCMVCCGLLVAPKQLCTTVSWNRKYHVAVSAKCLLHRTGCEAKVKVSALGWAVLYVEQKKIQQQSKLSSLAVPPTVGIAPGRCWQAQPGEACVHPACLEGHNLTNNREPKQIQAACQNTLLARSTRVPKNVREKTKNSASLSSAAGKYGLLSPSTHACRCC